AIINAKPKLAEYLLKKKIDPNGVIKEPLPDIRDRSDEWLGDARSGDMISLEQMRIQEAKTRQGPTKKYFHEQSYLIYAAKKGYSGLVRALLDGGADRNAVSNLGHTALTAAWYSGKKDIMEAIINEGDGLSGENRVLALIYAASKNEIDLLDTLLKKKFDPNAKYKAPAKNFAADFRCAAADIINKMDDRGRHTEISVTPLITAIVEGNLPAVKKLIAAGARTDIGRGRNAPLLVSIGFSRYEITRFLLESGADINATGPCGETPLIYAVYLDDYPTARLLVDRGADINAAFGSITAPVMSLASNNSDMINLFTGRGVDLKKQLNSNFGIDFLNWSGTPLKVAIRNQSVPGVRYILRRMQEMNDNFLTSELIHEACATQNYEIVKLLVDAGAPVTSNLLRSTLWHENDEIKKLIFDRKCHQENFSLSPYEVYETLGGSYPNEQYFTPFLSEYALIKKMPVSEDAMPWNLPEFPQKLKAVFKREFEKNGLKEKAAQIIMDRDALPPSKENIDVRSGNGNTALNALAEMPNYNGNLIEILLENGADINAKNGFGATPLQTALKRGTVETYELLSKKGADLGLSPSQIVYELTHDADRNGKLFLLYAEHLAKKSPPPEERNKFFELIISELRPLQIGYIMDKKIAPFDAPDSESVKLCSENFQRQYFTGDFSIKIVNCIYIAGRLGFTPERIIASIKQSEKNTADDKSLLKIAIANCKLMEYLLSKNIKLDMKEKKELIISAYAYGDASMKEDILSFMGGKSPADGIWNKIAAGDESEIRRNKLKVNENVAAMAIFLKNGKIEILKKIVSAAGLNNDVYYFKNSLAHAIDDRDFILIKILLDYGLSEIDSRNDRNSFYEFFDLEKKIIELGSPEILDDYAKKIFGKQAEYKVSFLKCLIRNNRKDDFFKYFEELTRIPRSSAPESPKGLSTEEIEDILSASLSDRLDEISDFLFDKLEGRVSGRIAQAALRAGNVKIARKLEATGTSLVNLPEALENNILKGDRKGFDFVLSKVSEKDINAPVKIYDNPLYRAINKNDSYYLEKLIDKGINLNPSLNEEGDYTMFGEIRHRKVIGRQAPSMAEVDTPLLYALDMNRDTAAAILARHEPSINKAGIKCRTALELAVEKNFTEAALAIVGRQDLDMRSGAIESAFRKAVTTENHAVIEALIDKGYRPFANFEPESLKRFIDVKNASIQAIILAMQAQNVPQSKITETLLKCGTATEEIFLSAIKSGDTAAAELLAAPGINVDYIDSNGKTALVHAIKLGREKTVDMLLKKVANPN
ncbi:MAG TPA: ankyrin repeat domain-containing protein, partial [Candidatus Wallbacteria bacterium]|nr:ankyrin repeat domain-containing protein [Candidatus Wallbacteria bacterium]